MSLPTSSTAPRWSRSENGSTGLRYVSFGFFLSLRFYLRFPLLSCFLIETCLCSFSNALYRFLLYWLADRTRALILFSSFLVPVSLRVCGTYVCVLGLRAVATCFVKIRTIFRGASGDVLHLRDVRVHASLIRAHEFLRSSLFAVSPQHFIPSRIIHELSVYRVRSRHVHRNCK